MKSDSKTDRARKIFSKIIQISLSFFTKLEIFNSLQKIFSNSLFLFHQNLTHRLFINLNAVKAETEFEAIVYHVRNKLKYFKNSKKMILSFHIQIQSILFLSRQLNQHEKHYWLTELEVTCLVWILWKIWHMIEAAKQATIIWTDHVTMIAIIRQISLTTSFTDKLNLCLIQAAIYIQQFQLKIHHKSKK